MADTRRASRPAAGPRFRRFADAGWWFACCRTPDGVRCYGWRLCNGERMETPRFPLGDGMATSPDASQGEHYAHVLAWLEDHERP